MPGGFKTLAIRNRLNSGFLSSSARLDYRHSRNTQYCDDDPDLQLSLTWELESHHTVQILPHCSPANCCTPGIYGANISFLKSKRNVRAAHEPGLHLIFQVHLEVHAVSMLLYILRENIHRH